MIGKDSRNYSSGCGKPKFTCTLGGGLSVYSMPMGSGTHRPYSTCRALTTIIPLARINKQPGYAGRHGVSGM